MKNAICMIFTLLLLTLGMTASATAQKGKLYKGVDWLELSREVKSGRIKVDQSVVDIVESAYAAAPETEPNENAVSNNLTGTWYCTVPGPTPEATFYAYQTFGLGGTFVETSSLLATLTEGPAQGVWERRFNGNILTFELFAFDPSTGSQVGRVRVRNYITMEDRAHFVANSVVDFIELDGTVIPNIAAGPFYGERVQLLGPR